MKIVVSSPFRAGSSWLVGMLCRSFDYNRLDFTTVSGAAIDNADDNCVIRTNAIISDTNTTGAVGIRLTRNIGDAVVAKLWHGVKHYLGKNVTISAAFTAFLNEVATYPVETRTPKNFTELAITKHLPLVNQFIRENMAHHLASADGLVTVTYEQLCYDAAKWISDFATNRGIAMEVPATQVAAQMAAATDPDAPRDLTLSNWCGTNLSAPSFIKLTNRINAIRSEMSA